MFKIEKNIPITALYAAQVQYPFGEMQVGDSILVPVPEGQTFGTLRSRLTAASGAYARKNDMKFSQRRIGDAIRIWRIK
jgi:hypothetical protein